MNEIMNINKMTGLTTVAIAELTGKRPDHVKRDAETMLTELYGLADLPRFGEMYLDTYGREQVCYLLPKEEVLILVSGYSIPLRAKIIRRLEELESQNRNPYAHLSIEQNLASSVKGLQEIADIFEVPKHLAQVEIVKDIKKRYNVDLSNYLLSAPAQNEIKEDNVFLEPTELGKHFGLGAKDMNKKLRDFNLQYHDGEKWTATDSGKRVSNSHQWFKGAKSGYNLKWNLKAINQLFIKD